MPFRENRYDVIAAEYAVSDQKPDKRFSILPTVLGCIGDVQGKTVLDLGCGDGFFTRALAEMGAGRVIGVDNSPVQLARAQQNVHEMVEYRQADIFTDSLPIVDVINSPFVLNYARDIRTLKTYLQKLFDCLHAGGKLMIVCDLPSGKNLEKFGAKKILEKEEDGAPIQIELYNSGNRICTLHAVFYKKETITSLLQSVGFTSIVSHLPMVSDTGRATMGEAFWEGYTDDCELGYITAEKK